MTVIRCVNVGIDVGIVRTKYLQRGDRSTKQKHGTSDKQNILFKNAISGPPPLNVRHQNQP